MLSCVRCLEEAAVGRRGKARQGKAREEKRADQAHVSLGIGSVETWYSTVQYCTQVHNSSVVITSPAYNGNSFQQPRHTRFVDACYE